MADVKVKILEKLNSLISEGRKLKEDAQTRKDPNIQMWMMRAHKLLERIGGVEMTKKFNMAGAFSYNTRATEQELNDLALRSIEARTNYLIVIKEDLELFYDKDEPQLNKIKNKFEAGLDFGVIKSKFSTERERGK